MKDQLEQLRALIENPDDLSALPDVITKLTEYQESVTTRESSDLDRITKLQESNRSLLNQIPVGGNEPTPPKEDEPITFQDAQEQLLNAMNSVGGN